jgi:DNA polymerase beta
MTYNYNLITIFDDLIKYIEIERNYYINNNDLKNALINKFRISKLKYTLNIIKSFKSQIKSSDELKNIKGIGKGSLLKIQEIIDSGKLKELNNYIKLYKKQVKIQKIIDELTTIIGIGPTIAYKLINDHNIKSIKDLQNRVNKGTIQVNDKLKLGLKYIGKFQGNIPHNEIQLIEKYLFSIIHKYLFNDTIFTICGSYRRELSFSSDIDILLTNINIIDDDDHNKSDILMKFIKNLKEEGFIIDDITSDNTKTKYMGFCKYKNKPIRRIDIRFVPYISYYTALLYFTGSYTLNEMMRNKAKKLGYKLSEYGLFDLSTKKFIYVNSELEIFDLLDMKYLKPNERSI